MGHIGCIIFVFLFFCLGSRVANAEVGAIVDDVSNSNINGYKHDIVVRHVGGPVVSLPSNHRMVDPLTYPILFPRGDDGWGLGCVPLTSSKGKQTHVSAHQYLKYRCHHRKDHRDYHMLHGRLTQEWIINNFLKIESDRLNYLQSNAGQKKLRADKYKEVQEAKRLNRHVVVIMSCLNCCNINTHLCSHIDWVKAGGMSCCRRLIAVVLATTCKDMPTPWLLSVRLVNRTFS